MTDSGASTTHNHVGSILVALLLFVFGDKSLDIAKLSLCAFDALIKESCGPSPYAYEFSLLGLAIGACVVVALSWLRKEQLKTDDITILIGLLCASIAAMVNILDAAVFGDKEEYGDIPKKALFFFSIWLWLFIVPAFAHVAVGKDNARINLSTTVLSAMTLFVALLLSIALRFGSGAVLLYVLDRPEVASRAIAFDQLVYRSDTLVIVGAVWLVATFHPFPHSVRWIWRVLYLTMALASGFVYGFWISPPTDLITAGLGRLQVAIGFAILSLAALVPSGIAPDAIFDAKWRRVLLCALATFALCATVMYAGLTTGTYYTSAARLALALLQGVAGALVPLSVAVAAILIRRLSAPARSALTGHTS